MIEDIPMAASVSELETWKEIWKAYCDGPISLIDILTTDEYLLTTNDHNNYSCMVEAAVAISWGLTDG